MPFDMLSLLRDILPGIMDSGDPAGMQIYPVGGGSINNAFQVLTKENKRWFGKFNDAGKFPDLFVKEDRGLALLRRQNIIRVPRVIACTTSGGYQVLLLEWIEEGLRSPRFWQIFGEQLARLHRITADGFGLEEDNYMGALPQDNTSAATWTEFFTRRRLEPQIRLAIDQGLLDKTAIRHFERLYSMLSSLFPPEPPRCYMVICGAAISCVTRRGIPSSSTPPSICLPGRILWNVMHPGKTSNDGLRPSRPWRLLGHRSMDLAMTTLFGGFDRPFYEAYAAHYPFPANYREQWDICNLYPLLIHLNLSGKSYQSAILRTIQRF